MVLDILAKPLSVEPFKRNCAEGFWTVDVKDEYHSSDEEEREV